MLFPGRVRDQLGQPVRLRRLEAQHPPHVTDHRPGLHGPEGDDLPHAVPAVLLPRVLDDPAAALVAEVDVDIGHGHAVRVQEPLEQQVEPERVHPRDPQGVGHQRPGRRAPPGPTGIPLSFAQLMKSAVIRKYPAVVGRRVRDHAQLVVQPLLHLRRDRVAEALFVPSTAMCRAAPSPSRTRGERERRHVVLLRQVQARPGPRWPACSPARPAGPGTARRSPAPT
jgi:hypothetical protein